MSGTPAALTRRPVVASDSLITRLGRRLAVLNPEYPDLYGVCDLSRPAGGEDHGNWLNTDDVVASMASGPGEHLGISPAVAGARIIGSLGYAALGRVSVALAVARQAYSTGPESLLMELDAEGLVQRIGVRRPVLAVLPNDRVRLRRVPGVAVVVLPDLEALVRWTTQRAFASLSPLIDRVHQATGYGKLPMWNLVADTVLGPAATAGGLARASASASASASAPDRDSGDPDEGTIDGNRVGNLVLDALAAAGAPITRRGSLGSVDGVVSTVRGSCCLFYRQAQEKCSTCPLVPLGKL